MAAHWRARISRAFAQNNMAADKVWRFGGRQLGLNRRDGVGVVAGFGDDSLFSSSHHPPPVPFLPLSSPLLLQFPLPPPRLSLPYPT